MNSSLLGSGLRLCLTPAGLRNECSVRGNWHCVHLLLLFGPRLWPPLARVVPLITRRTDALRAALVRNRWKACAQVARTPPHWPCASGHIGLVRCFSALCSISQSAPRIPTGIPDFYHNVCGTNVAKRVQPVHGIRTHRHFSKQVFLEPGQYRRRQHSGEVRQ